ncbi:hypothetical protein Fcan01_14201 [Folsomia candida]|uniref:Uncharacterized protein n=1 Tax=Folsomia candida TaxID=158441 RepID=A0A226DZA2_FOLCA|nr:hypothetical protein Fcan01_14201 [Folsomia candida]
MRHCCCSLIALVLLVLFILHLATFSGSPSIGSFFRFLFNFVFILFDVARNSSRDRIGLLRQGGGQQGFYSEEELLARSNQRPFNVGVEDSGANISRYEETPLLWDGGGSDAVINGTQEDYEPERSEKR